MTTLGSRYYYCLTLQIKKLRHRDVAYSQQGLDPGFDLSGITPDPELFTQTQSLIGGRVGNKYCFLPLAFLFFIFLQVEVRFKINIQFSSVQFSLLVMSDSLQPHEPQHARPPCPSPTPGVHPMLASL